VLSGGRNWSRRLTAAFAKPEIYEALETRGVQYAIRIPANQTLELEIEDLLFRTPGRPSRKPVVRYKTFSYQADSWTTARRVVAKVEHHVGELFPRVGFIVTNLPLPNRAVVRFYNKRGTAEQWIKEGKQAAHWTRLSCHRFRANEVRLQLSVLAYNLGNLWRRLVLPRRIDTWSLTSLQQRLVKTGGRLVRHARYYWLLLAESHLTRRLFGSMLRRIWALPVPTG
jgi:Transposase DDE domain group 1